MNESKSVSAARHFSFDEWIATLMILRMRQFRLENIRGSFASTNLARLWNELADQYAAIDAPSNESACRLKAMAFGMGITFRYGEVLPSRIVMND